MELPFGFQTWKFNRQLRGERILRRVDLTPWPSLNEWEKRMLAFYCVECVKEDVSLIIRINETCPKCKGEDTWKAPWTSHGGVGLRRFCSCSTCGAVWYERIGPKKR